MIGTAHRVANRRAKRTGSARGFVRPSRRRLPNPTRYLPDPPPRLTVFVGNHRPGIATTCKQGRRPI